MIIGREEQIERILAAVRGLAAPGGANVLFVTGEAGIGKSTLLGAVREACADLTPAPLVALAECSTPLAGQDIGEVESLEPWGRIMASLVTAKPERAHETRKLVTDLAVAWVRVVPVFGDVIESLYDSTRILKGHFGRKEQEEPTGAANQQQIFQQYVNFLDRLSERGPLVIQIDDFHWADTASSNLLFAAARQLQNRPVLFMVAYRPDDAASSRSGEGHPILHVRNELERYSLVIDVGVPKMTLDDAAALVRDRVAAYGSHPAFEAWLIRVSGGNALFISQFLHTLMDDGLLDATTGAVHEGFASIRVPASAHAVMQERVRRLSEEARELLRYASVEGDIFTSAVLAKITETTALKLLQKLRLLEETHRVIHALGKQRVYAGETSAFQFTHVLLHKALYEDLGEEERELLHEAVFDVLQEEWDDALAEGINVEGMAARLAVHATVLGRHRIAAEMLTRGAMAAWMEFSADETLHMLGDALEAIGRITKPRATEVAQVAIIRQDLLLFRAEVLRTIGRVADALSDVEAAMAVAEESGNARAAAMALVGIAQVHRQTNDTEAAEAAAVDAHARAEAGAFNDLRFDALTLLGHLDSDKGRIHEALEHYRTALDVATSAGLPPAKLAAAYDNLGCAADSLGRYVDAADFYRQGLAAVDGGDHPLSEAKLRLNLGVLQFRTGQSADARSSLERALTVFRTVGDRWNEMAVELNLGILQYHDDDHTGARARYEHALEIARALRDRRAEGTCLANLGEVEARIGDERAALQHFEESLAINQELGDVEGQAVACLNLAQAHARVRPEDSARFAARARALASDAGISEIEAIALGYSGLAHIDDPDDAVRLRAVEEIARCVDILTELGSIYAAEWQAVRDGGVTA